MKVSLDVPESPTVTAPRDNGAEPTEQNAGGNGLEHIAAALKGLRFGQVTVTVQDGVIVQVDRTERRRFGRSAG